jgi:two-component system NtrC family sensor kinase
MSHLSTVLGILTKTFSSSEALRLDASGDWRRVQERVRGMEHGLERIRTLVINLRTFSRMDKSDPAPINVGQSVDSTLAILQHRLGERISVRRQFGDPAVIVCDPNIVNQGVLNLIANGIDAIDGEGTIDITGGRDGADYVIRVADDGHGIPESIRSRVLEPFFTTKPVDKGTGLGLSITYSLVANQGGTLELRDRKGGGTEAIIRIPVESN